MRKNLRIDNEIIFRPHAGQYYLIKFFLIPGAAIFTIYVGSFWTYDFWATCNTFERVVAVIANLLPVAWIGLMVYILITGSTFHRSIRLDTFGISIEEKGKVVWHVPWEDGQFIGVVKSTNVTPHGVAGYFVYISNYAVLEGACIDETKSLFYQAELDNVQDNHWLVYCFYGYKKLCQKMAKRIEEVRTNSFAQKGES